MQSLDFHIPQQEKANKVHIKYDQTYTNNLKQRQFHYERIGKEILLIWTVAKAVPLRSTICQQSPAQCPVSYLQPVTI